MKARGQRVARFPGLDVDHQRLRAGPQRDRIEADQPGVEVADEILEPAAPGQAPAQRERRPLAATERPEHEGKRQSPHKGRMADAAIGEVVDAVETVAREAGLRETIGERLPHQMDQMLGQANKTEAKAESAQARQPLRHVELEGQPWWQAAACHLGFDLGPVAGVGEGDHLVAEPAELDRPMPADTGLRPEARSAGKNAEQDSHRGAAPGLSWRRRRAGPRGNPPAAVVVTCHTVKALT